MLKLSEVKGLESEKKTAVCESTVNSGEALSFAMDLGKAMVKCGAEINRVEETIIRVCFAYGFKDAQIFSIISMMVATVFDSEGRNYTQSRRIYSYSTDMRRLEQLNALSRCVCAEKPEIEAAKARLNAILSDNRSFCWGACVGSVIAASGFAMFFGGSWRDALASAPIALMIYLLGAFIKTRGIGKLLFTAICSALSATFAILFVRFGLADNAAMIMIGDIMLLIPGLMLINSLREMLCGDVMSGLMRLLESLIITLPIAGGFAVPILLFG